MPEPVPTAEAPAPATVTMIGPDGAEAAIPHAEAPKAFLEGGYGFPAGATIPMRAANGQLGHVPAAKAQEAFQMGAQLASPEEIHKAQIHADYDNFAGYLKAGAAEAANQALLGAGDALAVHAAKTFGSEHAANQVRQTLSDLREENPISSGVGGVVGAVAPIVASGGESAIAKVLSAPTRALGAVGDVAEGLGARFAPELGESLVGRVANAAIEQGARGAAEGAIINFGNELSEESLGDPELNGEKLLAALGHGALLGGAAGSILAGTGEMGREVLGRARPALEHAAGEQAFRTLNPERRFVKLAEKVEGGAAGVGRELMDQGVIEAGDKITDVAPKVAAARAKAGEKLGSLLGELDALGPEHAPNPAGVIDRVRREVIEPLSKLPGYKAEVRAVADYLEDFAQKTQEGLTYTGLRDIRAALDDKIFRGSAALNPSPIMKELQKMRAIVEDELTVNGDRAAATVGKDFAEQYNEAKLSYRRLAVADQAAQNATAALTANRVVSPSDYLAGIAGFAGGGVHGGITGMALGTIHHVIRERGNSAAAVLLSKAAALGAVQRAARIVDAEVDRGVAGVLEPGKRAPVRTKPAAFGKSANPYRDHADAVTGATLAPDTHAGDIEAAVAPIAGHAPGVAKAFQRAALRTTVALANAIPKGHLPPPSITPQFDKPVVSEQEKAKYERLRAIAHDPVGVTFSLAAKGQLTKADVDAFRAHTPKLYDAAVARTQEQLAHLKKPLDTQREAQLRVLMGMPPADPKLAGILAQTYVTPAGQAKPNQGPGSGPKATPTMRKGLADRERLPGLNSNEGD